MAQSHAIAFFGLEEWEKQYLLSHPALSRHRDAVSFIDDILDKSRAADFGHADIVSVFVDSAIDKAALDAMPALKCIAARSTGYDHIDIAECKKRGIVVSSVPTYGEYTVAEYAFALILCLSRNIYQAYDQIRETGSFSQQGLRGFDLRGKTLGVVGCGKIGRHVVAIGRRFEMNVLVHDTQADGKFLKDMGAASASFEELLSQSDIVTLHVPYIPATHHLMNGKTIATMKKGAYLINTSRGGIVETEALVKALKEGHLGGAGLDVLEEEGAIRDELDFLMKGDLKEHNLKTILANHILIDMPNVIITPHNAFNTTEALQRILDTTAENIAGFLAGNPINVVS
ncbi:MAG: hydroxyacid dehydrogenase [Candidatus Wildermuthbacteria bacterium]|nr:hydroxyacid dehydrogenase [Candidatus Wildermuthbacteria bacterium]